MPHSRPFATVAGIVVIAAQPWVIALLLPSPRAPAPPAVEVPPPPPPPAPPPIAPSLGSLEGLRPSVSRCEPWDAVYDHVSGIDEAESGRVIAAHLDDVQACYEAAKRRAPGMLGEGSVKLLWLVDGAGHVTTVQNDERLCELSPEMVKINVDVEACVAARIKRWTFPRPNGGASFGVVQHTFLSLWSSERNAVTVVR